jgi:hypothetical protein
MGLPRKAPRLRPKNPRRRWRRRLLVEAANGLRPFERMILLDQAPELRNCRIGFLPEPLDLGKDLRRRAGVNFASAVRVDRFQVVILCLDIGA